MREAVADGVAPATGRLFMLTCAVSVKASAQRLARVHAPPVAPGAAGVSVMGKGAAAPATDALPTAAHSDDDTVAVADGLLSAEFPPMMLQSLVENAIKHGLEPKPEGGSLGIDAQIVHGKLVVSVSDTGVGFGPNPPSGVGLANIRDRLQLLYGDAASLSISQNPAGGTVVSIALPYSTVASSGLASAVRA